MQPVSIVVRRGSWLVVLLSAWLVLAPGALAQATFKAQLRGTVHDSSGAVVQKATVTLTNESTTVPVTTESDEGGRYIFNNLVPASYEIKAEATGFKASHQSGLVLRVGQESDLDIKLEVGEVSTSVEVTGSRVLLNSSNAELGQEVTSRYVTEVPLFNRDISKLTYLTPGVTESQGFQANQTQENFVSNGQRNSSAEVRLDGGLLSTPEAGEGAMNWTHLRPDIEIVQEFKVQTNSFSAEYGNNGGTVVNLVSKSGGDKFHGSGYWFGHRSAMLDAKNFFSGGAAIPPSHRDDFGGSLGGPIVKQKVFFFFNYDRVEEKVPGSQVLSVPTDLQRAGDFSQTFNEDGSLQQIYNPFSITGGTRDPFPGNVIPSNLLDPVAVKIMALYPEPNRTGDPVTGLNNYLANTALPLPQHQYNAKVDYLISSRTTFSGRYSKGYLRRQGANLFLGGLGQADERNDYNNFVGQLDHSFGSGFLLTVRGGVDRHYQKRDAPNELDPTTLGFPSVLVTANGSVTFPRIDVGQYQGLGLSGWTKTIEAQSNFLWDAAVTKVVGPHSLKFGAEGRTLLSNFFQPAFPGGDFGFNQSQTQQVINGSNTNQGNPLASLLVDFGSGGFLSIHPSVAQKSKEASLFVQDDWQVNSRLTLNLGVRYEWSTPYTERHNRIQFADFTGDSGVNLDLSSGDPFLQSLGLGPTEIRGIAQFATSSRRAVSPDRNNIAPRLGLAYRLGDKTVLRAGGGIYYGINPATSYQDVGPAYRQNLNWFTTLDSGQTRNATLANPFPQGAVAAQGTKYGLLNTWGYTADSNQSNTFRNSNIYQWSASVQHELPGNSVIEVAYSANRSTHLPFGGTKNRNFLPTALREQISAQQHALDPNCDIDACVTNYLNQQVQNPFYPLFVGPNAIFNEPNSGYAQSSTFSLINLLRPYPQFGGFEGFNLFSANATYNSLQMKYEKRYSQGVNIIASYTLAKETDDSSYTSNGYLGNAPNIQDIGNLKAEHGIGATDVRNRLSMGGSYELPFGRGKKFGTNLNRAIDTLLGGWQANGTLELQSALPISIGLSGGNLADGSQRPNVSGSPRTGISIHDAALRGVPYLNAAAYSNPGDQIAGNAPRFDTRVRGSGIRNIDLSLIKNFAIREAMKLQFRAEFFNFTNTPRFYDPDSGVGDGNFGKVTGQSNNPRQVQFGAKFTF